MADKKVEAKKGSGKKSWFSRVKQYWKDTAAELKKVIWPTKEQTRNNTVVVIAVVIIAAIFMIAVDAIFGGIISLLVG